MNIFKVLSRGDGSINEPNVSAFLAYLLDPKSDHGLNDTFLGEFLYAIDTSIREQLIDGSKQPYGLENIIPNTDEWGFSTQSKYEIEVFVEQAFKQKETYDDSKRIVDIIVAIYEKSKGATSTRFSNSITSNRSLLNVLFIENKIKKSAKRKDQIIDTYKKISLDIGGGESIKNARKTFVYITPDHGESESYLDPELIDIAKLNSDINVCHLIWDRNENEEINADVSTLEAVEKGPNQISNILRHIIRQEAHGLVDPINIYTQHTLKSFVSFIRNDFKSTTTRIKPSFKKDVENDFNIFSKKESFADFAQKTELANVFELFKPYSAKIQFQHSKTHPISVFRKTASGSNHGNKILQLSRYSSGYKITILRYPEDAKIMNNDHYFHYGHLRIPLKNNQIDLDEVRHILDFYMPEILN